MAYPVLPTPPGRDILIKRSPMAKTLIQEAISGRNIQQPLWTIPRYKVELKYNVLAQSTSSNWGGSQEWQTHEGFWKTVKFATANCVFAYNDPNDNSAVAQSFGTGDSTSVSFQLSRTLGGFAENVNNPSSTSMTVFNASTATTAWSLGSYGIITFTSAPANGNSLTWTGSYNWLAQFDEDTIEFDRFMYLLWKLDKMLFTTWHP